MDLTPREQQVADLVIAGLKAREIGHQLGITEQVVKNHKVTIYKKLGVRNAVELVLLMNGKLGTP